MTNQLSLPIGGKSQPLPPQRADNSILNKRFYLAGDVEFPDDQLKKIS